MLCVKIIVLITTTYGKKGLNSYLTNKERKVLNFYNKKRTNQWLASRGLQLPKLSNNDSSFNYILCLKIKKYNK